jgi:SEC-C motif-containing protein
MVQKSLDSGLITPLKQIPMAELNWPSTPRALLEARYKAFVSGNIDFIIESHHPEIRDRVDRRAIEIWSTQSKWHGLSVESESGSDSSAQIMFSVKYEKDFEFINHREKAEFRKLDEKWFYFDSEFLKPESVKREGEKVGRNDPCSCGSGKKFKKCCGA